MFLSNRKEKRRKWSWQEWSSAWEVLIPTLDPCDRLMCHLLQRPENTSQDPQLLLHPPQEVLHPLHGPLHSKQPSIPTVPHLIVLLTKLTQIPRHVLRYQEETIYHFRHPRSASPTMMLSTSMRIYRIHMRILTMKMRSFTILMLTTTTIPGMISSHQDRLQLRRTRVSDPLLQI
jgi:hypothetical protein